MTKKVKTLSRNAMLKNINGLSLGDRAYCGPYGTITCTKKACAATKSPRRFTVAHSSKIRNGGNHTMKSIRKAIYA